jgi:hypothetical protein
MVLNIQNYGIARPLPTQRAIRSKNKHIQRRIRIQTPGFERTRKTVHALDRAAPVTDFRAPLAAEYTSSSSQMQPIAFIKETYAMNQNLKHFLTQKPVH